MNILKLVYKILKPFIYFGFRYKCPICLFKARKFLPAGLYEKRNNAKCPNCGSLERHRFIYLYLDDFYNKSILHFAPANCLRKKYKSKKNIFYKTSDYPDIKNSDFNFNITEIDNNNQRFDIIIVNHILEHIENDKKAMKELYRILNPNGFVLIMVPLQKNKNDKTFEDERIISNEDRIKYFGQYDHVRLYGYDIKNKLAEIFDEVSTISISKFNSDKNDKYCLRNTLEIDEPIFIAKKT